MQSKQPHYEVNGDIDLIQKVGDESKEKITM